MMKYKKEINEKLKTIEENIYNNEELKKWDKQKKFDFKSNKDLKYLLYNCLDIQPVKETEKGNPSLDHEALEKMNLPITDLIIEYRRWFKAVNTYIAQYRREVVDGYLHPFFNLGTVRTFRSSSSAPNFQNIPKRDEEIKNIVRNIIIPRQGNKLIEYDFKSMEVSIAGCVNKDPNLIKYLKDVTTDMHRDVAADLFLKDKDKIDKDERYVAKNQFVFAEFYGSYYEDTARGLWENMPDYTKEHLKNKGIGIYEDFEDHVKEVERIFWDERFFVYKKWKRKTYKEYEEKGYVDLISGFRCHGPIKFNEVINYQIQGPAFHCLLWTFNRVMEKMKKFNRSFLIGQIHDSILGDIHPDDEKEIDYWVWHYGTQEIMNYFKWIIVPLRIEKESSEINGSWAKMNVQGFLEGNK